jgi:anthranilate synthase component 2
MKILVIDNYDSFTYNLVQYIWNITGVFPHVVRNDAISVAEVNQWDVIILSPGPGLPKDAGIMHEVIKTYYDKKPILGVCLGHQAIGEAFGAELGNLTQVFHGVSSFISPLLKEDLLFKDLPPTFEVGRYHSWVVKKESLPAQLVVLSSDDVGQIMAMKHAHYPVYGVQFHPESIMTPYGKKMLENFLNLI